MSARLGASARRSQAAVLRQNPVVRGLDCVEGLLRRKRIKPQSQQIYQAAVDEFHLAYRLSSNSSAAEIDTTLDAELVRLYLSGESPGKGKVLYYAVRWHHCLPNAALPRAFASRQGHSEVQRSAARVASLCIHTRSWPSLPTLRDQKRRRQYSV